MRTLCCTGALVFLLASCSGSKLYMEPNAELMSYPVFLRGDFEFEPMTHVHANRQKAAEGQGVLIPDHTGPCSSEADGCEHWQRHIKIGPWTLWHENGQKRAEVAYAVGMYEECSYRGRVSVPYSVKGGSFKVWYPNGQLAAEGEFATRRSGIETLRGEDDRIDVAFIAESARFWDEDGSELGRGEEQARLHEQLAAW